MTFTSFRITDSGGRAGLSWTEGRRFTLPSALVERLGWANRIDARGELALPAGAPLATSADAAAVRSHAAFTDTPPVSARLPISYRRVPAPLRAAIASAIGRVHRRREHRWATFPGWPLDLSADLVSDLAGSPRPRYGDRTPVLLTHDIDSAEGLRNLVDRFLPLEEAAGARSANYVVPCAWPVDATLVEEVGRRGHEIGVHGYDHGNRTPFADAAQRRARLDGARSFRERYCANGYRAPSLLRTRALLRDLAARYHYDSSIPTSGGPFPVPNNGCASARPFRLEGIVELPVTLPRDGSLRFLGYSPRQIVKLWTDCAEAIARSGGIVVLLTHCEARFSGNPAMLAAYTELLACLRADGSRFTFMTPRDLIGTLGHVDAV
ncbi:MAG TPA: hypothetical protein VKD69_04605 [Vicinamibacterales bacterium]|nr:hypothetical protein [Vicinamibacterales bacterium]